MDKIEKAARRWNRQQNATRLRDCVNESNPRYKRERAASEFELPPRSGKCFHDKFLWEECTSCRRTGETFLTHTEVAARVIAVLRKI